MAVLAGLYDVIEPNAISKIHLPLSLIVLIAAFIYGLIRAWPRPVEEHYTAPNTTIRVVVGDLFARGTNLVVGACDTFDTATPHIIQKNSVQGQLLEKVYQNDHVKLDDDIAQALANVAPIEVLSKPGKTLRYPIGTVAAIRDHRTHYFCVAYTVMNEHNQAEGTPDRLWKSLLSLWDSVQLHANGDALSIPVIGGGQSRMSHILPAQDSIRFIILSFIFASRRSRVCESLDIIVRPEDAERVDMPELQAFLTSLKPS
ncbi:macro domain-containing protein [Pseudonocardia sulfidoxydans]|nr:macro domain-containing protein [Pseudonocardia sulfidoxydans]